ncbi:MAG: hypothetical protein J5I98_34375, partial [Phaeodactylibacter sp.]|nr:hypothetical protein [Phaeodactylibacter sp.]
LIDMKNKLKKTGVILFLLGFPLLVFGQKHDYVWMFGYNSNATPDYPGIEGVVLNFNDHPPEVTYVPLQLNLNVSSSIMSDKNGNLLFYTNGCSVANFNHEIMENGEDLNPGEVHDIYCEPNGLGYIAGAQSSIVLPHPRLDNIYILFHKHLSLVYKPEFDGITDTLYYSVIDMQQNSGKGKVMEKNVPLITENMSYGQMTAVKHSNGADWWLITPADESNEYFIVLLTQDSIEFYSAQSLGGASSHNGSRGGQAVISPDGTKYIRYSAQDGVFIFDFDRRNGVLSNFEYLPVESEGLGNGVAVSPNSRFLYISAKDTLFQFDLEVEDIFSSGVIIGVYDNYLSPFPTQFHNAQLAPDCKIYVNSFATVDVLHVIHNPDEPGLACNFEQHAVQLPFNHARSLPHFPNYRLGPLVEGENPPPPCEPVVSTEEENFASRQNAYIFPNPAPGYFKVVFEEALRRPGRVVLYNGLGQAALETQLEAGSREFRIELSGVAPGLYFYGVFRDGVAVKGGKLVVAGGR